MKFGWLPMSFKMAGLDLLKNTDGAKVVFWQKKFILLLDASRGRVALLRSVAKKIRDSLAKRAPGLFNPLAPCAKTYISTFLCGISQE
jgi:hypothetical protein